MTDLAIRPDADAEHGDADDTLVDAETAVDETPAAEPEYQWAPADEAPKKRRVGMWVGIAAGVTAVAVAASSLVLIAPGTAVAGVPVGWLTAGAATDALQNRLAETTVVLTGAGGDVEVTGADLGATVDGRALADTAFADHPMWNVSAWFAEPLDASIALDAEAATAALRAAAPDLYTDPVDAVVSFDAETASYVTTPAVEGTGIDIDALRLALQDAYTTGQTRLEFDAVAAPVTALTPTYVADATVSSLNEILDTAGFYVGDERTVPVSRDVAASWLTVTPGDRGTFEITADEDAIAEFVPGLAEAVNRDAVDARVITDTGGEVLREEIAGVDGRVLGETSTVSSDYAAQLANGDGVFQLPVEETPFATTALARNIVVDLSEQRVYLYENGGLVSSYLASTGLAGSPTHVGNFRINWKTPLQDLGCFEGAPYCTEDVPWLAYFNGDQALHGAYWHNNFGNTMSHGCVNLPPATAKFVYDWSAVGTEVRVQY